jgi:small-conductance mechanosensitive channel
MTETSTLMKWLAKFFNHVDVSGIEAMVKHGLQALLVLLIAYWIWRILTRIIDRHLNHSSHNDEAAIKTYKSVARLIVFVPGILIAVHVLGLNLSSAFTTGGLFAVALAFAMKNIAENFISGLMIRFEKMIKPGDVLETEGAMVRIRKIGLRATTARTKDEKDLLIPNSQLVQDRVANFTYRDSVCRVWTFVGVSYSSDLKTVREVLEGVCENMPGLSQLHAPEVLLTEFGDSAVNYKVSIWIENPWDKGPVKSNLNEAIWWALRDAGISIAFPQIDVHFDKGAETPQATVEHDTR